MDDLTETIRSVDWENYETAYGNAKYVGQLLELLSSSDMDKAMKASFELWCGLCHQDEFISSASLPSYPILLFILRISNDEVADEILRIIWGFASCSADSYFEGEETRPHWAAKLRLLMKEDIAIFKKLTKSENKYISDHATWIIEDLEKP
ncbi:MAG: hypothetical protein AAGF53_00165 [Pseudomonadota bacterium]